MRHVVAWAAAAVLLAGCSGEPEILEPDPTPTSARPEPAATPPAKPSQFDDDSKEGAAAHVYYWVSPLNYAATTGEAEELVALSANCEQCGEFAESARDLADDDRPSSDTWTIDDVGVVETDKSTDVTVGLTLLGGEQSEVVFQLTTETPYSITDLLRYEP